MKCKKCGKEKHSSDFYFTSMGRKRKSPHCSDCRGKKQKANKPDIFVPVGYNGGHDEIFM
jgi:NAD-dependent SIR2 family protein deacetylase